MAVNSSQHRQHGGIFMLTAIMSLPIILGILFLFALALQRVSMTQLQLAVDGCALAGTAALTCGINENAEQIAKDYCNNAPILASITSVSAHATHCDTNNQNPLNNPNANCMLVAITANLFSLGLLSTQCITTTAAAKLVPQPEDPGEPKISRAYLIPSITNAI